jgi:hypothetical protein
VLANFDHGKPAVLRKSVGKGEINIMASGWQPEESQFALSSKFLPLMLRYVQAALPEQNQSESVKLESKYELLAPVV